MPLSAIDDIYLTPPEAASRLRMSERWLRGKREIARYKIGKNVRYKVADLDRYMELHRSGNSPFEEAARDHAEQPRGHRAANLRSA